MTRTRLREIPCEPGARPEIAAFIERATNGYVGWADVVLSQLVAGPEAVCDLWRGDARAGVAVSIDGCATEGDAAEVSVFPAAPDDRQALEALLGWGEARAAAAGRSNIDVPVWPGTGLSHDTLAARGYRVAYVVYDMHRPAGAGDPKPPRRPLPAGWRWAEVEEADMRRFHETASLAFEGIPGAFVPELDAFAERQRASDPPPQLLLATDPDTPVAGFLRIEHATDGAGVLGILARHPRYRGHGLGEHLVHRGLSLLRERGARGVRLDVAAKNRAALSLYESYGFGITNERAVYRRAARPEGSPGTVD